MPPPKGRPPRRGFANRFRIVAGRWRGRRLEFVPGNELRPTPDRVRETLFNWLAPVLPGARCLDLCAGSGALGLEALSRAAAEVVFVELDPAACRRIREHLTTLDCADGRVVQADARGWLAAPGEPFDVVFVDPPYASGLAGELCTLLANGGWLAPGARVYVEYPRGNRPDLDAVLTGLRHARAGQVEYELLSPRR